MSGPGERAPESPAAPEPAPDRLGFRILAFCFLAAFVDGIDTQTLAIAVPLIARDWGMPLSSFAPAFASFSAGLVVGSILAGWTSDKVGLKQTLLAAVLAVGISTLLVPLTSGIAGVSAVRFFGGAGVGGAMVVIVAICAQLSGGARGGRMAMIAYIGAPLGYLAASLGGARLLDAGDWEMLFYVSGALPLVLAGVMAFALPPMAAPARPQAPHGPAAPRAEGLFGGRQTARTLLLWLLMLLGFTAVYLLINWLPSLLTIAGLSAGDAAVTGSVVYVGSIIGTLAIFAASARVSISTLLTVTFALGTISALVIHVIGAASGVPALVALTVLGLALGGGQIALMIFSASLYEPEFKGRGVGWANGVGRLGSMLGPVLGGWLIASPLLSGSIFTVLAAFSTVCAAGVAILGLLMKRPPETPRPGRIGDPSEAASGA